MQLQEQSMARSSVGKFNALRPAGQLGFVLVGFFMLFRSNATYQLSTRSSPCPPQECKQPTPNSNSFSLSSLPPTSEQAAAFNMTLSRLAKTELQIITWHGDVHILSHLWHSMSYFVPCLMGLTIIYEEEDSQALAGVMPPRDFPFPVKRVSIPRGSTYNVKEANSKKCREIAQNINGMNRLGYIQQQVYNMFADELSQFDSEYILLTDSDAVFAGFEWLAGSVFASDGLPSYAKVAYSSLGDAPQKWLFKPGIDSLLGVENEFEYMLTLPRAYKKEVFRSFRQTVMQRTNCTTFMTALQSLYVDNRVCKEDYDDAMAKYGVMSNFNWLTAYVYFYQRASANFDYQGGGMPHLGAEKRNADVNFYGLRYSELFHKYTTCKEWFCYTASVMSTV